VERWRGKGSCLPPGRVCPLAVFAPWPCLPPGGSGYEALSARLRGSSSRPCERAKHPSSGDPRRRAVGRPSLVAARSNTPTERAASTSTRRIHIHIHATSASTPRPHPRHVRIHAASDIFAARCGVRRRDPLALAAVAAYVALDAEPSRKERGRRGVRPCHPNRQTFGSGNRPSGRLGRVPRAARNRVVFVLRPTASIRIRSACQRTESQSSCPRPRSTG
jgi:hypothetical protein